MPLMEDPISLLMAAWAEGEAIRQAEIKKNVKSIEAVPWPVWQHAGNRDGAALRNILIALAEAGEDVYCYESGHDMSREPYGPTHYNVWLRDRRLDLLDLANRNALIALLGMPTTEPTAPTTPQGSEASA